MVTIPWTDAEPAQGPTALVMVSRFRLSRRRDVAPFLVDALRVHRQMRRADGLYGISLVAHPIRREFWTLSAWRDRDSMMSAVREETHRRVMARYRSQSKSAFEFFTVDAGELPISWAAAIARIPHQAHQPRG